MWIIINTCDQMTNCQTENVRVENTFAALILTGFRDVEQLRSANKILRIPSQCLSWREFLWVSLHLLTL